MKIALRKVPADNGWWHRSFLRQKCFLWVWYPLWIVMYMSVSPYTYVHFWLSLSWVKWYCDSHIFYMNYLFLFWVFHLMALRSFTLAREKSSEKILQHLLTATSNTENYFKEVFLSFWGPSGSKQVLSQITELLGYSSQNCKLLFHEQ